MDKNKKSIYNILYIIIFVLFVVHGGLDAAVNGTNHLDFIVGAEVEETSHSIFEQLDERQILGITTISILLLYTTVSIITNNINSKKNLMSETINRKAKTKLIFQIIQFLFFEILITITNCA